MKSTADYYRRCGTEHGPKDRRPSIAFVDVLARRARTGDRPAMGELTERVIAPLAHALAGKAHRRLPWGRGLTREDMMQEASAAMLHALKTWKPEKGTYRTHAHRAAHFALLNATNSGTMVTINRGTVSAHAEALLRGDPAPPDVSPWAWAQMRATLEGPLEKDEPLGHTLPEHEDGYDAILDRETLRLAFYRARRYVVPKERDALSRRFGLDVEPAQSFREIAEANGYHPERARQLVESALDKLRLALGEEEKRTQREYDARSRARRRSHAREKQGAA